jgi:hypothetical protein
MHIVGTEQSFSVLKQTDVAIYWPLSFKRLTFIYERINQSLIRRSEGLHHLEGLEVD